MSDIMVLDQTKVGGNFYFELSCGTKIASIYVSGDYIKIICKNAMHKAYRGSGKHFWKGWEEAMAAYKSPEMKSMIAYAQSEIGV